MASRAAANDTGVIKRRTKEAGGRCMAALTSCCCLHMVSRFGDWCDAGIGRAAMASRAAANDAGVVHRGAAEAAGVFMTSLATGGRWNMGRWFT